MNRKNNTILIVDKMNKNVLIQIKTVIIILNKFKLI
jgi:hypothetical protein